MSSRNTSRVNAGRYCYPARLYLVPTGTDFGADNFNEWKLERDDLWVSVMPKAASEQNVGDQMAAIKRYELRTPWTPDEIHERHVIATSKSTFAVNGVINRDEADYEWQIMATKIGKGFKNAENV